jgi:hypothetical protein
MPKNAEAFVCECCDFQCFKQSNYDKHITTRKHKKNDERMTNNDGLVPENSTEYKCECGNKYKYRQGLWSHKKKCEGKPTENVDDGELQYNMSAKDLILVLINQNKEMQDSHKEERRIFMEKLAELSKTPTNSIAHSNNNNSNNSSFNLNFFLNEQCKDAINLVDFIDNLNVTVKDLERTGRLGFVEGISQIFIDGLKELDIYKRPIHCTDLKRETAFVREKNKWEKDTDDKDKLNAAVKKVVVKNFKQLNNWKIENPEFADFDSKKNEEFMIISKNSLGGYDKDQGEPPVPPLTPSRPSGSKEPYHFP